MSYLDQNIGVRFLLAGDSACDVQVLPHLPRCVTLSGASSLHLQLFSTSRDGIISSTAGNMFAASRTNPSLFRQLENGVVHCGLTEDERSATFLPESVVYEVLTKESITATLSWSQRLYSRWSPGNSLTDKIHSRARKVFAVLILIGEESKISDLIYNDGITDDHLPLVLEYDGAMIMSRHSSKRFHSFKSWDARRVRDFLDWQWVVLAPVLDMTDKHGKHIILDPKCPLPIENSVLKERGSHVSLYQAHLHPAHQLCPHGVSITPYLFSLAAYQPVSLRPSLN